MPIELNHPNGMYNTIEELEKRMKNSTSKHPLIDFQTTQCLIDKIKEQDAEIINERRLNYTKTLQIKGKDKQIAELNAKLALEIFESGKKDQKIAELEDFTDRMFGD